MQYDSFDDFDEVNSPRPDDNDFSNILHKAMSRRGFIKTTAAFGTTAFVMGTAARIPLAGAAESATGSSAGSVLGFQAVPATSADTITLPPGYKHQVVASWGDPIFSSGSPFDPVTRGTGASQELALGDNNDGMALFPLGENHGVFVVNHEYVNRDLFHPDGVQTADDVRKSKAGHGVGVFEIKKTDGKWNIVMDGALNRRITADTPMELTGPVRGHDMVKTAADPEGVTALGTWNNCGNGETPWGTYLACEENFNGYFATTGDVDAFEQTPLQKRYGVGAKDWGYSWYQHDERFDLSKNPNEPNRFGYIVEIDPMDPNSVPKKRTALGRFKHENAAVVIADNGHVVVYLGDDERGEHLYRFVSKNKYVEGDKAANSDLLEEGTLYVAQFDEASDDLAGSGRWIALLQGTHGLTADKGFNDQGDVILNTRTAASAVGGTTMDRPEWVVANPNGTDVYVALTNNKNRGKKPNAGGIDTPVNGPNPRVGNLYGQVVRWNPVEGDHTGESFEWDIYALAGNPTIHDDLNAGSANITADNMFNSPDGLGFDENGRLWIQTDGNYSNEEQFAGMGNNQMLCGDPATGEIRRFLVGPISCEVTGVTWSPDRRTLFVGIQHPGEKGLPSHFPDGGDSVPRSSIVAVTREDGGIIGT